MIFMSFNEFAAHLRSAYLSRVYCIAQRNGKRCLPKNAARRG